MKNMIAIVTVFLLSACGGGENTTNSIPEQNPAAPSYFDTQTGLSWQTKTSSVTFDWNSAGAYCAGLEAEGKTWRLPSAIELFSILDYDRSNPAIDPTNFEIGSWLPFSVWSSTQERTIGLNNAYDFDLNLGYLYSTSKDDIGYSLCVSGPQLAKNIISSNSDDTAIDLTTGLQWQKSSYPTAVAWAETSSICSAVSLSGKTDWRVPSISELASIIDFDKYSPTINTIIFSDTDSWPASKTFWSATTYYENAWFLRFEDGAVQHGNKEGMFYVRCVRTL